MKGGNDGNSRLNLYNLRASEQNNLRSHSGEDDDDSPKIRITQDSAEDEDGQHSKRDGVALADKITAMGVP